MTPAARFGDQLRRERERAGISLASIAFRTNVTASHFAALERGDCSNWPPGVYSRAFLRGYAVAIGLHPEQVLAEAAQYFSNFNDERIPFSPRKPETRLELRLQLDAPQPDWQRRLRAAGVFGLDAAIAIVVGIGASFAGGSFWVAAAGVLAVCYAVSLFRSPAAPRSAFVLPRGSGKTAPPTPAEPEAFGEDVLEVDPLRG